ncbi:MAG TPA: hypothetical protein VI583_06710, partial [Cyclobacteriaceae bacterium]|nr:hypothetical protein [Cyclobacteriaceae bacterium]
MCSTCGCGQSDEDVKIELLDAEVSLTAVADSTSRNHDFSPMLHHAHHHSHDHGQVAPDEPGHSHEAKSNQFQNEIRT